MNKLNNSIKKIWRLLMVIIVLILLIPFQSSSQISLAPVKISVSSGDTLYTWNQEQSKAMRKYIEERNQFKEQKIKCDSIVVDYADRIRASRRQVNSLIEANSSLDNAYTSCNVRAEECSLEITRIEEEAKKQARKDKLIQIGLGALFVVAAIL